MRESVTFDKLNYSLKHINKLELTTGYNGKRFFIR